MCVCVSRVRLCVYVHMSSPVSASACSSRKAFSAGLLSSGSKADSAWHTHTHTHTLVRFVNARRPAKRLTYESIHTHTHTHPHTHLARPAHCVHQDRGDELVVDLRARPGLLAVCVCVCVCACVNRNLIVLCLARFTPGAHTHTTDTQYSHTITHIHT